MTVSASSISFSPKVAEATVAESWKQLAEQAGATLVDVRTEAEWQQVGVADLAALHKKPIAVSWRLLPGMVPNAEFEKSLMAQVPERSTPLFFLCKSGGRSFEAASAMAQLGYAHCTNITGGFESWMASGLSWSKA